MLTLPGAIDVIEVGPRDGLQSLTKWIDTKTKIAMIDRLSSAGFPVIEATSFVHPKFVPNLADAEEVIAGITRRPGTIYRALVPNLRGVERALDTDIDEILGLITVSETYLKKNQNMTLDEAIESSVRVFERVASANRRFIMAIGVAMLCPYEGLVAEQHALSVIDRLYTAGIRRFYLAASTGMEEPRQVYSLFSRAYDAHPDAQFGFHVHEKMGLASANVLAALQAGTVSVEGSICGIGGGMAFPGGHGSIGNLATEDIVQFLNAMDIKTGIPSATAYRTAHDIAKLLDIVPTSHHAAVGTRAI